MGFWDGEVCGKIVVGGHRYCDLNTSSENGGKKEKRLQIEGVED